MKKHLFCLLLAFLMLFSVGAGALAEDDEEVSIEIYSSDGRLLFTDTPAEEEEPVEEAPAEEAPKTEKLNIQPDGSILLTLSFTGDVTIGDNVQSKGTSIFEKELKKQAGNINFPFRNVRDIFLADDLTMINFEGTLTTAGRNRNKTGNEFLFRANPEYVSMLNFGGVDTVTLENNHVLDMGEDGLKETKYTLNEAGISYACEGEPAIITVQTVKIGSLAYQTFGGRHDEIIAKLPQDIQALRDQGCEIVIVSYHWGAEKDYTPNENQVRLGRATIDAGADLVIGHHSHRINPIEYYNGHYICYSLGNFSFAGNNKPSDMSTYIFQIRFGVKDGQAATKAFRIIPCRISSRTDYNDFCPTPYTKSENISSVQTVLLQNSQGLEYAVEEYPLTW